MTSDRISKTVTVLPDTATPVSARPAGYAALADTYDLRVPAALWRSAGIIRRHTRLEADGWLLRSTRYAPAETLAGHLEFALKWEGVNLPILAALFKVVPADELRAAVLARPTGRYARRLWFLYEWLTGKTLDVPDPGKVRAVPVLDDEVQFALAEGTISTRHRVLDNLPGTAAFCPLVRRTPALDRYVAARLPEQAREVLGRTHPDVIARAAAFLLLSDSQASFNIEGERPAPDRARRWARAIGQAGTQTLDRRMLESLQRDVIGDHRFVLLGLRVGGGFVGTHERTTGLPMPEHISARAQDLPALIDGMIQFAERATGKVLDPVVAAAALAFGFVYIHPFEDGNGRVHRWLIHHALARAGYNPLGLAFPVSAVMLREIDQYKRLLESYSRPLLTVTEWRPTERGNVEVLNETADFYRYFDATAHAEFLYHCVATTIGQDLPNEVAYLEAYDRFVAGVRGIVDMPGRTLDLLHRFLHQNGGRLSQRAREKEFSALTDAEAARIERLYEEAQGERHPARR
ncbi:MAG: Fic family protein [Gammaproteobacteria bacterium]|nr:Fic family protein [Gammaproteobacteria bacterium]